MYRLLLYIIVMMALMLPFTAAANTIVETTDTIVETTEGVVKSIISPFRIGSKTVPDAAKVMANDIDEQMMRRAGEKEFNRLGISLAITVPVHLSNFEETNALARQMSEELSGRLAALGYGLVEIRKAQSIQIAPRTGETILTRDTSKLAAVSANAMGILTGTYVISKKNVRFNMKIVSTVNNTVFAMSNATVPITADIVDMLSDKKKGEPVPSVRVRLP